MVVKQRTHRSEAEWREVLEQFRSSGMSRKDFLEREGISRSSFEKYLRRFYPRPRTDGEPEPRFVEVLPLKG